GCAVGTGSREPAPRTSTPSRRSLLARHGASLAPRLRGSLALPPRASRYRPGPTASPRRHGAGSPVLDHLSRHAEEAPRAPARARLSLSPSRPGEVHEMSAARGAWPTLPECVCGRGLGILARGGFA